MKAKLLALTLLSFICVSAFGMEPSKVDTQKNTSIQLPQFGQVEFQLDEEYPEPFSWCIRAGVTKNKKFEEYGHIQFTHIDTHTSLWTIERLFVTPSARQKGIARELFKQCMHVMKKHGCHTIKIHANPFGNNPVSYKTLVAMYDKFIKEIALPLFKKGTITIQEIAGYSAYITYSLHEETFPLQQAARTGNIKDMQTSLKAGVYINTLDSAGQTPLHHASSMGHDAAVQLLLNAGAKIYIADKNGQRPLDLAIRSGHDAVVKVFQAQLRARL